MKDAIKMSLQEASDLLNKWTQENRIIHVSLICDSVTAKIPGRLDSVDGGIVHFSLTKSKMPLGSYAFVQFPLSGCKFEYSDAEHAPEPLRSKLTGYDALLYIYRRGITLGFAVMSPTEELLQL